MEAQSSSVDKAKLKEIIEAIYVPNESRIIFDMAWNYIEEHPKGEQQAILEQVLKDLKRFRPIQYIIGKTYFSDFEIAVQEGVLIPRPETDELVDWIIKEHKNTNKKLNIWDIGTGSGCIALALKRKLSNANLFATDVSYVALNIAKRNAAALNVDITFLIDDILVDQPKPIPPMDIIVSNPPYILSEESKEMEQHILAHEPHLALFVTGDDPLQFYKAIERIGKQYLNKNGLLYLELHASYATDTQSYFEEKGWNTLLKRDMQGADRMLKCIMN